MKLSDQSQIIKIKVASISEEGLTDVLEVEETKKNVITILNNEIVKRSINNKITVFNTTDDYDIMNWKTYEELKDIGIFK